MNRLLRAISLAAVSLLSATGAFGQGSTIDQLTAGGALGGTEKIPMFQTANPAKTTTPAAIATYVLGSTTFGTGLSLSGSTISLTSPARSTSSAALVSTDAGQAVINTSGGMTIANATGALGDGFGTNLLSVAAATLTPTTATINGNATEPFGANQGASLFSKGGQYYAILGMPEPVASSVLVASSGRIPAWQAGTSSQYVRGDGSINQSAAFTSGTLADITGLGIRDTSAAFDLTLAGTSSTALTAGRTLTFDVVNGARTVKLGSNLTIASDLGTVTGIVKSNGSGTFAAATAADVPATPLVAGTGAALTGPSQFYVCTTTCTVTPPVPVAGYQFCVMNSDNVATAITLAALGSSARYENTARTAYGAAGTGTLSSTAAAASSVCILGLDSTHYLTTTYVGTWTAS